MQGIPAGRRLADGAWLVSVDAARWPGDASNAPIVTWLQGASGLGEARTPHAQGAYLSLFEGDFGEAFRRLSLRSATPDDFDNPLEYRVIRVKDALSETPTADRGQLALLRPGDAYGLLYSQPELPLHERLRAVMRVAAIQDSSVDLTQTTGSTLPLPGDVLVWLGPASALAPSRVLIAAPEGLDLKQLIPDEQTFARALSSPISPASVTRRRVPPTLSPSPIIAARTQQLTAAGLHDAASADLILWWFHVPNGGMQVALGGHALSNPIVQALLTPPLTPYRERWSWYTRWFQSLLLSHQHAHPESSLLLQTLCKSPDASDQARCTASIALNMLAFGTDHELFQILESIGGEAPDLASPTLWTTAHLFARHKQWDLAIKSASASSVAAQESNQTDMIGIAWLLHAQLLQQSGDPNASLSLLLSPPPNIHPDILHLALARSSLLQATLNNDTSDATLSNILSTCESLPPTETARTLLLFGQAHAASQPQRAKELLQRAADTFDKARLPARAAAIYLDMLALETSSAPPDPTQLPNTCAALALNAASRFVLAYDHTAAAESFLEASRWIQVSPSLSADPSSNAHQALLGALASARDHFSAAKQLDGTARAWLLNASVLLSQLNDPTAAIDALTAASLYAHASNDPQTAAESEWHLAQLRRRSGADPATVNAHLQESARFATACGPPCDPLKKLLAAEGLF